MTDSTIRHAIIVSTRSKLSDLIKRAPIPVGTATISAAMMTRQAIPASNLRPVKMSGMANGNTTVDRIRRSDDPSVLAAWT